MHESVYKDYDCIVLLYCIIEKTEESQKQPHLSSASSLTSCAFKYCSSKVCEFSLLVLKTNIFFSDKSSLRRLGGPVTTLLLLPLKLTSGADLLQFRFLGLSLVCY